MLERPTTHAIRKRRYRHRRRDGLIILRLEVREAELAEAMLASGRLDNATAEARSELERAAEGVLAEWAARWLQRRP
jgi:hypothetical protein